MAQTSGQTGSRQAIRSTTRPVSRASRIRGSAISPDFGPLPLRLLFLILNNRDDAGARRWPPGPGPACQGLAEQRHSRAPDWPHDSHCRGPVRAAMSSRSLMDIRTSRASSNDARRTCPTCRHSARPIRRAQKLRAQLMSSGAARAARRPAAQAPSRSPSLDERPGVGLERGRILRLREWQALMEPTALLEARRALIIAVQRPQEGGRARSDTS